MLRYVPGFILDSSASHADSGSLSGFVLFADIVGFTDLSNVLCKEGKKGAEALNQYLTDALSYPIDVVEKQGGFVSHFAGDAFYAIFPDAKAANLKYVVDELKSYYAGHDSIHTGIDDFPLKVRLTVCNGKVNWGIYRLPQQAEYLFSGKPFQEIIKLSAPKLDMALSPSVQAAFDAVTTKLDIPKQLEFKYDEASERQFLNPKLHGINPDNEIRDAGYCFIDMSWLEKDQIMPTLSLIHDKLDDYGGYLNKLDAGDKGLVALVLFGIPKAMGNTLERACRFALETIAEQPNLAIGLSCGNAYAGFVGSESTREYTALGAAVNLASRLMQEAKKGEILTDNYLEQEMHYKYRFESASSVSLKGFAAPVHCNRLIDRLPAPPQSFLAELVGRETELELIRQSVDESGSRILYISGDPGIGKSRLIIEALKPYPNRYFLFCDPSGHKHLEPITQFLRQYFKYEPLLSREQNQKSFRAKWNELAGDDKELLRIESIIGNLLGFDWEGSIWSMLPPEERPEQQRKAFATMLARITETERLIIHLDDPQWLDATDMEYFRQLGSDKLEGIVIIAACRYLEDGTAVNLEIPNWDTRNLDLNRLNEAAAATLINHLLKVDSLPLETRDWIVKKADGNPLFIEQVVAYLKENDCFDSEHKLKGNLDYLSSFGITDIIGSRIDNLTESVRNTLQHACILGMEFNTRVLSEMLSRKLDDDLGEGKQARVWADIDELRYIFTHVLIKDTAYNRMLSDKLMKLHLLAAETIERLYQDDEKALQEYAEEIGLHYLEAGDDVNAAKYYNAAGVYFTKRYMFNKAHQCLNTSISIYNDMYGNEHITTADSVNNLAGLYYFEGKYEQAAQQFINVLETRKILFGLGNRETIKTMGSIATIYYSLGKYDIAEQLFLDSLSLARTTFSSNDLDLARMIGDLACLYWAQGNYAQSEALHREALGIRKNVCEHNDIDIAESYNNMGVLLETIDRYAEAEGCYKKALSIRNEKLGPQHPETIISSNNLATLFLKIGKSELAEEIYVNSLRSLEPIFGSKHPEIADIFNNLSSAYSHQNKMALAEECCMKALQIRELILGQEHPDTLVSMNNLGLLYCNQGRYMQAEPLQSKVLSAREKVFGTDHTHTATAMNNLASTYQHLGMYDRAETLYNRAIHSSKKALGEEHSQVAVFISNLAGLYRKQNKFEEAKPLYIKTLAIFTKTYGDKHPNVFQASSNLVSVYNDLGEYDEAELLGLKSLTTAEAFLGKDHPRIGILMNNLATLYEKKEDLCKAEKYQLKSVSILEKSHGCKHPQTAISMFNLGRLRMKQNRYTEAVFVLRDVLFIRTELLGIEHPDTQKTIKALIDTYEKLNQPEKADEYRAMLINSNGSSSSGGCLLRQEHG